MADKLNSPTYTYPTRSLRESSTNLMRITRSQLRDVNSFGVFASLFWLLFVILPARKINVFFLLLGTVLFIKFGKISSLRYGSQVCVCV